MALRLTRSPALSRSDVRVGQRSVLEFPHKLALDPQRLRIVTPGQGGKEHERQVMDEPG